MSWWDVALLVLSMIFLLVGLAGTVAPIIPWSRCSLIGVFCVHWTSAYDISAWWLRFFILLVLVSQVIDYYLPIWGTKKYGGSKYGIRGSIVGTIVGLFILPPLGLILGPFVGAFVGEYLAAQTSRQALRAARWSFVGFLLTVWYKLIIGVVMLVYCIQVMV